MDPDAGKIVLNGAPSQYDRWLPALDADYAAVDGRSFTDLLNFPIRYGALVNYYNLNNEIDGDWVGFFLSDPTMMLAALESVDFAALEQEFARLYELTRSTRDYSRKFDHLTETFAFIQSLARKVNDAVAAFTALPQPGIGEQILRTLEEAIVTSLGPQLRQLKAYGEGAGLPKALGREIPLDWSGFLPIWNLRDDCPDGSIYHGHSRASKIDHALPYLVPIFAAFQETFVDLQQFARANFEASLHEPDHKPQIGLYIAFARLFASAQATINTISSRYIHFYYQDLLHESPAGPIGDQVYVTFTLATADDVMSTAVSAGTLFPAGQDAEGRDILYASEKSLQVMASQIGTVYTLRAVRGPLALGQPNGTAPPSTTVVTQRILGSDIALAAAAKKSIPWPTFGAVTTDPTAVSVTQPATLGFAIAAPSLMLAGGQRDIGIVINYADAFKKDHLDKLLDELGAIAGLDNDLIFETVLDGAFTVLASTEAGWFILPPYKAAVAGDGQASFTLHFTLPPTAPPIAAYNPPAAEGQAPVAGDPLAAVNPAPDLPTFKFYLNQKPVPVTPWLSSPPGDDVEVFPLSLLDGMPLEAIRAVVDVDGLTDIALQSTSGPVDPTQPFALFGAPAVVGSYLDIYSKELFVKRVDTLDVTVDWFGLPPNTDGFKGYYRNYTIGLDGKKQKDLFTNASFLGSVTVINPGSWEIDNRNTDLYLFKTEPDCTGTDPVAPLCPAVTFDFGSADIASHLAPAYYKPGDGAVRLALTAPPYAFGDDLYAQNVLNAVISDLPDPANCQEMCEAEYAMLAAAAQSIGECLDECNMRPDNEFQACITKCLALCSAQMLISAIQCLWECVEGSKQYLGSGVYAQMKASFDDATAATQADRAKQLEQWVEKWRGQPGIDPACFDKCMFLIDAIIGIGICLISCASEPADGYRACVSTCVKACQTRLEEAYAQFVHECVAACSKPKAVMNYPNMPWLPTAKSVAVSYTAGSVVFGDDNADGVFFHLTPFDGYRRAAAPASLLPVVADEGSLLLGFTGMLPPQTLTLLFQMAANAGSVTRGDPAPVRFAYLSHNEWTPVSQTELTVDETNGLENSGILAIDLPAYDPVANTVLAGDRQWLRASVAQGASLYPDTIGIYPNVTTAVWQNVPGGGNTLDRPLPPHTIVGSVQPLPDVDTIDQPMESFGGRPAENARDFQMRLGERLRHKDRAIASWDYERLVLARFPTVWKVQALPAHDPHRGSSPGDVLVVVVGGPDCLDIADPTVPSVSGAMLTGIEQYLKGLVSPFVRVHAVNPVYVRITVSAKVQFASAGTGASLKRLNDDLVQYLSPWFYDAARAAKGGRYADSDEIEAFIEAQPGVDGLWDFDVSYDPPVDDLDWYFLTSAKQHDIIIADMAPAGVGAKARIGEHS